MTRPHSAFIFVLGHVIHMCMTVSFYSIILNLIIQNSLATLTVWKRGDYAIRRTTWL